MKIKRPLKYEPNTRIKERPLAFYDMEFSGLEFDHEIVQMGCVLVSQSDLKIIKKWKAQVIPEHIENADKNALTIIGYSKYKPENGIPLRKALLEFNKLTKNAVLIGFNSSVDYSYLKKAYYEQKIKPAFHWQLLDVLPMAFIVMNKTKLKGIRMKELISYFKLKPGKWHDALADADMTYKIYKKLLKYEKII